MAVKTSKAESVVVSQFQKIVTSKLHRNVAGGHRIPF